MSLQDAQESLALGYLAGALRSAGHDVALLNAALKQQAMQAVVDEVANGQFDLVGLTVPEPSLAGPSLHFAALLRDRGFAGHMCAGGQVATFEAEELLTADSPIDSVVLHEGEHTICDLTRALERGGDWRAVPGLAFRGRAGVLRSEPRPPIACLDDLGFPARDDLSWLCRTRPRVDTVPIQTSRGCHYDCAFCSVRAFYQAGPATGWRRRSAGNVLAEMDQLSRHGVSDLHLVDDLFVSRSRPSRDHAAALARALLDSRFRFTLTLSMSVDSLEAGLLAMLKQAGLRRVLVGAEAASQALLRSLRRWFTPAQIAAGARALEDAGLEASISFINFTPMTRMEDLRENLRFFVGAGVDLLDGVLNRYQVYRGAPLFSALAREKRIRGAFPCYDYVDVDPRVELAYTVVREALGALFELQKELERRRELVSVWTAAGTPGASNAQSELRRFRRQINRDLTALVEPILDFAEARSSAIAAATASIVEESRAGAMQINRRWLDVLSRLDDTAAATQPGHGSATADGTRTPTASPDSTPPSARPSKSGGMRSPSIS